eukprot:Awhi_evm1s10511
MKFSMITVFAFYPAISTSVYSMAIPIIGRTLEGNVVSNQHQSSTVGRICVVDCENDSENLVKRNADGSICIADCDDEAPRETIKRNADGSICIADCDDEAPREVVKRNADGSICIADCDDEAPKEVAAVKRNADG